MDPDDIAAELREDNQLVSSWLIYYREMRRVVMDERDCILHRTQQPGSDRVTSSAISNPAAARAFELIQKTEHDMLWLETIEMVSRMLGPKKLLLLNLRQLEAECPVTSGRRGRPGWVIWVQRYWSKEYAKLSNCPEDACCISDQMMKKMWNEIIFLTARVASKRGLLSPKKVI